MPAEKIMIKKLLITFLFLTISASAFAKEKLIVGTYDSFTTEWGPGLEIEKMFEEICECDLEYIATSQAGTLTNNLFVKNKDVILGVEAHNFDYSTQDYRVYDYGYFAFIYNKENLKNPPKTFDELLSRDGVKLIVQDPRTSPVGLGLLRWMKTIYKDNFKDAIKTINKKIITYTPGWSEAYGMFLEEKSDIVLSYSTSPYYHQEYENDYRYEALIFEEGHLTTKEIVYVTADSKQKKLGRQFIDFMLDKDVQNIIASKNIMYPVSKDKDAMPKKMAKLIKPIEIDYPQLLVAEDLISEWLKALVE
tara:strand:- start:751 stop:1668 length:918 start_codon:yes stop_codon:yes gene_type:complete